MTKTSSFWLKNRISKAAIKREHNDASISYAGWEHARAKLNTQQLFCGAVFLPLMLFVVRIANPLMTRPLCENLLSGTNERGSNEGRRSQTEAEGFFNVFVKNLLLRTET